MHRLSAAKAEVVRKFAAREGVRVQVPVIPNSESVCAGDFVQRRVSNRMSETVRRAETVFFLGESHALAFAERIVLRDGAPPLMCQPLFLVNGVALATITTADGKLNGQVRSLLRASRLVVDVGQRESDCWICRICNGKRSRAAAFHGRR